MDAAFAVMYAVLAGAPLQSQTKQLAGTLTDALVADVEMARIELKRSEDRDLPGVAEGDPVFRVKTPQFRPAGAPDGLSVALVETSSGWFLFVDTNVDNHLSLSERTAYTPATEPPLSQELSLGVRPAATGAPLLPFKCRVVTDHEDATPRHYLHFTASFRAEGHVNIGGRRTKVSLPFDPSSGHVDVRNGRIGIDANGDGRVDFLGLSGPEVTFAKGDRVIFRVGERYVSFESADFAARAVVLREHPAEDYVFIEVRANSALPDFAFTDFDGRARRLSDFKGKYVLLDFWGSWCGPCLADLPLMKAAYEQFRDRRFEILGIDYEYNATAETVRALLKEKDVRWPNATPESVRDLVANRFRISAFPTLILLDPDGVVIETRGHLLRGKALSSTLERILGVR